MTTESPPRFKVTSVTGYGDGGGPGSYLASVYQILDTAYGYALIYETPSRASAIKGAAALEAGDFDWPRRRHAHKAHTARYRLGLKRRDRA